MGCCGETQGIGGSSGASEMSSSSGIEGSGQADFANLINALLGSVANDAPLANNSGTGSGGSGAGIQAIEFS
jgi:hypothetical protein